MKLHLVKDSQPCPEPWRTPRAERERKLARLALGIVTGVIVVLGGEKIVDKFDKDYAYSDLTRTVEANKGDGINDIAGQINVIGDSADTRDLAAHLIDTNPGLSDGLQNDESVVIPNFVVVS